MGGGTRLPAQASRYRTLMWPLVGAAVGGLLGGPAGALIGAKVSGPAPIAALRASCRSCAAHARRAAGKQGASVLLGVGVGTSLGAVTGATLKHLNT